MVIKNKNLRKALSYNVKTSEYKTERNLNEEKFGLKPCFKEEKIKVLSTRLYVSQIHVSFQVRDYSNLNCEYFADLYCNLKKLLFAIKYLPEQMKTSYILNVFSLSDHFCV